MGQDQDAANDHNQSLPKVYLRASQCPAGRAALQGTHASERGLVVNGVGAGAYWRQFSPESEDDVIQRVPKAAESVGTKGLMQRLHLDRGSLGENQSLRMAGSQHRW